jgi:tRNA threonylcarbamoyladenosine biosynthesis protein TsaB
MQRIRQGNPGIWRRIEFGRNGCFSRVWPTNCPIIGLVLILALDTSSPSGSIAVLRDEKVIGVVSTTGAETYSSRMFRQLEFLLAELKLSHRDFDLFAVNSGPGSFTGLRVGLTAAKCWAEVYAKPAAPISGLEAVAAQSRRGEVVVPVLDARRGQAYFGFYRRQDGRLMREGDDRVATPEEFLSALRELPESRVVVVTSDGDIARKFTSHSETGDIPVERVSNVLAPVIGALALERARRGATVDALALDANYVRRSDAELHWKGP